MTCNGEAVLDNIIHKPVDDDAASGHRSDIIRSL